MESLGRACKLIVLHAVPLAFCLLLFRLDSMSNEPTLIETLHQQVDTRGEGDWGTTRKNKRRSPTTRRVSWLLILVAIAASGFWFVNSFGLPRFASLGTVEPQLTYTVGRGDLIVSVLEQGQLESSNNTEIKCKVRGFSTVTFVVDVGEDVQQGDLLVRLDTKRLEDEIGTQSTEAHMSRATYERAKADVANAEVAIEAYLEGSYRTQLKSFEQLQEVAQQNYKDAQTDLQDSESLMVRGYVPGLDVEARKFNLKNAELDLKVSRTAIEVLEKYTKQMELTTLRGNLSALQSRLKAEEAGLAMDEGRRDRAIRELEFCEIRAPRDGMVIYPSSAEWKSAPDITPGANVRKDQILLLMPDLLKMQVKVGIHESMVDRVRPGMRANVKLPDLDLQGIVKSVATVAKPAGWWTGNVVKYDAVIELPNPAGVKPGMSAGVEIVINRHEDVLTIPVSSAVDTGQQSFCWVQRGVQVERRTIELGASNDVFVVVKSGLEEGEVILLDPSPYLEEIKDLLQGMFERPTVLPDREPNS